MKFELGGSPEIFYAFDEGMRVVGGGDVRYPTSLVETEDGDFYGTGYRGSTFDQGAVFKLDAGGEESIVQAFPTTSGSRTIEGLPTELIGTSDGNFYGTTALAGDVGAGVGGEVFTLTPEGDFSILCLLDGNEHGSQPHQLIEGSDGDLYGIAQHGGEHGAGTIFQVSKSGDISTLFSFNPEQGAPIALAEAGDGALYGATSGGGDNKAGTLFRWTRSGEFTQLHQFTLDSPLRSPNSLIVAANGDVYGVAGSVFKLTADGELSTVSGSAGQIVSLMQTRDGKIYGTGLLLDPNKLSAGLWTLQLFEVE